MSERVLYYDGKTSAPHLVELDLQDAAIYVHFIESDQPVAIWPLDTCTWSGVNSAGIQFITSGSDVKETLQLNRHQYPDIIAHFRQQQTWVSRIYDRIRNYASWKVVGGGIATILLLSYCYIRWLSPWMGERVAELVPRDLEVTIGQASTNNLLAFMDTDSLKTELLTKFYEACKFPTDYKINCTYVDDPMVNGMSTPGGNIIIFDGIVQSMDSFPELAGLLGHELAHINHRHGLKALGRSVSAYILLSAITGDVAGVSGVIMEQAGNLNELSFSRDAEKESDLSGLKYLRDSRIDPNGIVNLFKTLQAEEKILDTTKVGGVMQKLKFLSTHPLTENRIKYIESEIKNKYYVVQHNALLDSLFWEMKKSDSDTTKTHSYEN